MTTILTRLYADAVTANAVGAELERRGFGDLDYDIVALDERDLPAPPAPPEEAATAAVDGEEGAAKAPPAPAAKPRPDPETVNALSRRLAAAGVPKDVAESALERVCEGAGLVVVRAPFGFATTAETVLDAYPTLDAPGGRADAYRPASGRFGYDEGDPIPSVLPPGSLFMTGPVSGAVLRRREPLESSFGMQLIVRQSARPGRARIPKEPPFHAILPLPLLIDRGPVSSPKPPADPPFSRLLGIPYLIRRESRTDR